MYSSVMVSGSVIVTSNNEDDDDDDDGNGNIDDVDADSMDFIDVNTSVGRLGGSIGHLLD